jgi:hypothetical protein
MTRSFEEWNEKHGDDTRDMDEPDIIQPGDVENALDLMEAAELFLAAQDELDECGDMEDMMELVFETSK